MILEPQRHRGTEGHRVFSFFWHLWRPGRKSLTAPVTLFLAIGLIAGQENKSPQELLLRILVVDKEAKARDLFRQLEQGASFAELARQHSIDPSAVRGGYLGRVSLDRVHERLAETAGQLEPGYYSPPVRVGSDYFLVYRLPEDVRARARQLQDQADILLEQEKVEEAVRLLKQAIELDPEFIHGMFDLAVLYGQMDLTSEEERMYRQIVEIAPDFPMAQFNLGQLLLEKGDLKGAEKSFLATLEARADYPEALVNLSAVYQRLANRSAALQAARQAAELNPLLASAYYNLGIALGQEDPEGALENFRIAATLDPNHLDPQMNVAIALALLQRPDEAVSELRQILGRNPHFAPARQLLSRLTDQTGTSPGATTAGAESGASIDREPGRQAGESRAEKHAARAREALLKGDFETALMEYDQALALKPGEHEFQFQRAWTLVAQGKELKVQGRLDAARQAWHEALGGYTGFVPALKALAELASLEGRFSDAEKYLAEARVRSPDDPEVILLQSRLEYERRNLPESFRLLSEIQIDNLDNQASLKLIEQLLYLDLQAEADKVIPQLSLEPREQIELANIFMKFSLFERAEKILKQMASGPSVDLLLGRLYASQLRFEEAERVFHKLLEQSPSNWPAHFYLAEAYLDSGHAKKAIQHLQAAHRLQPENVNTHLKLGEALVQAGRPAEAMKWLKGGLELEPDSFQLHFEMGKTLLEAGDLDSAESYFTQVLEHEPDHVRTHYLLGRLYQQKGNLQQARDYLLRFRQLKESLDESRQRLLEEKDALKNRTLIPSNTR